MVSEPSCSGHAPEPRRPVGAVPGGGRRRRVGPRHAGDAGQGGGGAQGGDVHEGDQGLPAVLLLPHGPADRPLTGQRRVDQPEMIFW